MGISDEYRGFGLAIGYYVTIGVGSIAIKLFMDASTVETTMFLWYLAGTVLSLALLLYRRSRIDLRSLLGKMPVYMVISLIMSVAVAGWFLSVLFAGPGVAVFVQQLGIVVSVLLGAFALGERLTWPDVLGGTVATAGALSITYRSSEDVVIGAVIGSIGAVAFAAHGYLIKRHIAIIDKFELLFVRTIVVCALILCFSLFTSGLKVPSASLLVAIPITAAIVHVGANLMLYVALDYADLAKVSILMVVQPMVAMAGAYWVLHEIPTVAQLVGGFLILVGISTILLRPLLSPKMTSKPENWGEPNKSTTAR